VFTALHLISKKGPQWHEVVVAHETLKDYLLQVTARTIQGDIRENFSQKRKKVKEGT
jgi:hypothetical protein